MGAVRGTFAGILVLVALETVLSSDAAASRSTGLLTDAASIIDRVLSPAVAAIPNLSGDDSLDTDALPPRVDEGSGGAAPGESNPAPITTKVAPPAPPAAAPQ